MPSSSDVLIVGAGLAGLSAAITLQEAGRDVRLIESSDRPGGRVTSDVIDGFICECHVTTLANQGVYRRFMLYP